MQGKQEVAIRGAQAAQEGTSVGKALGNKFAATVTAAAVSMGAGAANAAIEVPPQIVEVFTDLGKAFGTLMLAAVGLFAIIRGGVALFKLAGRLFSAAGA
jgi:hypothetical protein